MKREKAAWLLLLGLLLLLPACGKEEAPAQTAWSEAQMALALWDSQGGTAEPQAILFDEGDFAPYLSEYYQIPPDSVEGGAILFAGGVSAQEVAVLRLTDADAAGEAEKALGRYINDRAGAFAGYAPEQYAIVERSGTASRGQYAALLICPDQQAALDAFAACFTGGPPAEEPSFAPSAQPASSTAPEPEPESPPPPPEDLNPPEEQPPEPETPPAPPPDEPQQAPQPEPEAEPAPQPEPPPAPEPQPEPEPEPEPPPEPAVPQGPWSYDRERIVNAWTAGNREGLWEQDLAILAVLDAIPALTDGTLSDYARELALHDWMLAWAEYDPGELSNNPRGEPMPDNDNPYGFLTGKKGICRGYASTFQLLMDLSGIECRTVDGMSHAGTAEHAWNLVKLGGDWYAVDVTWDDPVTSRPVSRGTAHRYFNVTSEFLRQADHQWDESSCPEAEGTALAWGS